MQETLWSSFGVPSWLFLAWQEVVRNVLANTRYVLLKAYALKSNFASTQLPCAHLVLLFSNSTKQNQVKWILQTLSKTACLIRKERDPELGDLDWRTYDWIMKAMQLIMKIMTKQLSMCPESTFAVMLGMVYKRRYCLLCGDAEQ